MLNKLLQTLESRSFFYIAALLFRIILDISYITFQSPVFGYMGYKLQYSSSHYILSWILTIVATILAPNILNKVSDYFIVTFCFAIFFPMASLYGLNSELSLYTLLVNFLSYLWITASLKFSISSNRLKFPYIKHGPRIFRFTCYTMILYLISWYFVSGATANFNLDFGKVYDYRSINSSLTNIGILAYLNGWTYKVFNLSLIAYALYKKKKTLLILLIIIQVFFYGVSAHKAVVFTPIVLISIYFYFTKTRALSTIPLGFFTVVVFCLLSYFYLNNMIPGSLMINRVFYIPNYYTFVYFDFFSNNDFSYWSDSFNVFLEPIYSEQIPSVIGNYMGRDEYSNNGYISSGFAQAGIYGVAFYNVLITVILKAINNISKDLPLWFALCIVITALRTLIISADLMTTLLTHGLFLSILMLILVRKPRQINNEI